MTARAIVDRKRKPRGWRRIFDRILCQEHAMQSILGCVAFAVLVAAQLLAVIALRNELRPRHPDQPQRSRSRMRHDVAQMSKLSGGVRECAGSTSFSLR